jgi:glycosyltransferase involved in cell wall biosynthesis
MPVVNIRYRLFMKTLIIIEPHASGHRMHYVRHIVGEAVERGLNVYIATWPESTNHASFRLIQDHFGGCVSILYLPKLDLTETVLGKKSEFRKQYEYYRIFSAFFEGIGEEIKPDYFFIPYLNMIDKVVPILGSPFGRTAWSGIVMRDTFHHRDMGVMGPQRLSNKIKKFLFLRLLKEKYLQALFTIDPTLPIYLKRRGLDSRSRVHYLPEPVALSGSQTTDGARASLNIPQSSIVVLVYGAINARKRVDILLEALSSSDCPKHIVLLIAGRHDGAAERLMHEDKARTLIADKRLFQLNAYLTDRQEYEVFRASDIVWIGYQGHFTMSAVLMQAGAMALPVLSCREGLIGWMTTQHNLGLAIDAGNSKSVMNALVNLASDENLRAKFGNNGLMLSAARSQKIFSATVMNIIEN